MPKETKETTDKKNEDKKNEERKPSIFVNCVNGKCTKEYLVDFFAPYANITIELVEFENVRRYTYTCFVHNWVAGPKGTWMFNLLQKYKIVTNCNGFDLYIYTTETQGLPPFRIYQPAPFLERFPLKKTIE